jgi:aspartyl-tRNA(Asn)/glutamyl-tRNA(Gln) amidotransferase subunit A
VAGTHALTASYVFLSPLWHTLTPRRAFDNSYLKALHLRHTLRADYNAIFRTPHPLHNTPTPETGIDLVLHSTAIRTAPLLSKSQKENTYAQDLLTVPASLAGLPCVSVPYGTSPEDEWPVGVSLTGQWGMEGLVLDVARVGVESFR